MQNAVTEIQRTEPLTIKLVHDDCLNVMREMPDKSVDLIVSDPPYGLKIARRGKIGGGGRQFTPKQWDSSIPRPEYFYEMRRVAKNLIIWGGNYFTAYLQPSRGWLVWYKNDKLRLLFLSGLCGSAARSKALFCSSLLRSTGCALLAGRHPSLRTVS